MSKWLLINTILLLKIPLNTITVKMKDWKDYGIGIFTTLKLLRQGCLHIHAYTQSWRSAGEYSREPDQRGYWLSDQHAEEWLGCELMLQREEFHASANLVDRIRGRDWFQTLLRMNYDQITRYHRRVCLSGNSWLLAILDLSFSSD